MVEHDVRFDSKPPRDSGYTDTDAGGNTDLLSINGAM